MAITRHECPECSFNLGVDETLDENFLQPLREVDHYIVAPSHKRYVTAVLVCGHWAAVKTTAMGESVPRKEWGE